MVMKGMMITGALRMVVKNITTQSKTAASVVDHLVVVVEAAQILLGGLMDQLMHMVVKYMMITGALPMVVKNITLAGWTEGSDDAYGC